MILEELKHFECSDPNLQEVINKIITNQNEIMKYLVNRHLENERKNA